VGAQNKVVAMNLKRHLHVMLALHVVGALKEVDSLHVSSRAECSEGATRSGYEWMNDVHDLNDNLVVTLKKVIALNNVGVLNVMVTLYIFVHWM